MVDWAGVTIGLFGDGLAIWALIQAGSAKRAVTRTLEKSSYQTQRDDARVLLSKLNDAKDAAMGRRPGSSPLAAAGRTESDDVHRLQLAQDALATITVGDINLVSQLRRAASQLNSALQAISSSNQDGWASALAVLQGIIPSVESMQRKLGMGALH